MMDIVGFGALNVDLIYEVDNIELIEEKFRSSMECPAGGLIFKSGVESSGGPEKLPPLLHTLEECGRLKSKSGGGSAANTIVALARMGFDTGYVGKVGNDRYGDFLIQGLGSADCSEIKRADGQSGVCISLLSPDKERALFIFPNSNDALGPDEIDSDYIRKAEFLHMTSFIGDGPFEAQKLVAKEVSSQAKISFDPGELYAKRGLEELLPLIENSYMLFPNGREIELITGKDYKSGARQLLNLGPEIVACKLGRSGSYILSKDEEFEVPAIEVEVLDKTGAGDCYAAGFLAGLLKGFSSERCAQLATMAACRSIEGYGRSTYPGAELLSRAEG